MPSLHTASFRKRSCETRSGRRARFFRWDLTEPWSCVHFGLKTASPMFLDPIRPTMAVSGAITAMLGRASMCRTMFTPIRLSRLKPQFFPSRMTSYCGIPGVRRRIPSLPGTSCWELPRRSGRKLANAVWSSRISASFHALPQVQQHTVSVSHPDESEPWVFYVHNDIHRNGHGGGEADDVDPTAQLAAGHAITRQQRCRQ